MNRCAIGVVFKGEDTILISKRHEHDSYGGYWEFPGGTVESGESLEDAVERELLEETDVFVKVEKQLTKGICPSNNSNLELFFFKCRYKKGEAAPKDCAEVRWVHRNELKKYKFPPVNLEIINDIIK